MNKEEHLAYLDELLKGYGNNRLCFPKAEGAFYWGEFMSYDEYCDKYKQECINSGWLNDNN